MENSPGPLHEHAVAPETGSADMTASIVRTLTPDTKDVDGLAVQRLLPSRPLKTVGPFIFLDHLGPTDLPPGRGIDIRPHPHIGLATVTYLFDGHLMHRDSLGSVQRIVPGDMNWMIAGRGIVHSERSGTEERVAGHRIHGIQSWIALPKDHEQTDPQFTHYPKSSLPYITVPGVRMHLIAGRAFGAVAPTVTFSDMFYVYAELSPGAEFEFRPEYPERGLYAVGGEIYVDNQPVAPHHLAVLAPDRPVRIRAAGDARMMLLGGAALDGERIVWWNFVASSRELIDDAKHRWRAGEFPPVPGDTEFIPLPAH